MLEQGNQVGVKGEEMLIQEGTPASSREVVGMCAGIRWFYSKGSKMEGVFSHDLHCFLFGKHSGEGWDWCWKVT